MGVPTDGVLVYAYLVIEHHLGTVNRAENVRRSRPRNCDKQESKYCSRSLHEAIVLPLVKRHRVKFSHYREARAVSGNSAEGRGYLVSASSAYFFGVVIQHNSEPIIVTDFNEKEGDGHQGKYPQWLSGEFP
jgi:hypothetical protein